ncbi:cytosol aminopeptidase-like [Nilaparvata lugens]|uniref:cytosol aminopeptidase-like n=1 Tax=Nilaparvata lugens TaxID=108931 RepID=UPI00193DDEA6|nr:cytosol aminopeptidase-like [Nilaparvata lugens]
MIHLSRGLLSMKEPGKFFVNTISNKTKYFSLMCGGETKGLVLGAYENFSEATNTNSFKFTETAETYNKMINNKLYFGLLKSGPPIRRNEVRMLYGLDETFSSIAVVGLGKQGLGYNEEELIDEQKEQIREAAAMGSTTLRDTSRVEKVFIESFGNSESAAEGISLGLWSYLDNKSFKPGESVEIPQLELFDNCDFTGWKIGLQKGNAQNLARKLCEMPANYLTPRKFAEQAVKILGNSDINLEVKTKHWLQMKGMDALLAVAKGSCEEPLLLEATYYGCEPHVCPVILIGKGVTFDAGGHCLKTPENMAHMRGDMAGAACVIATLKAVEALRLPLNIRALIPMCENMLGPRGMKPGDIVKAMNGKTIHVDSTDSDGRLVIVDALSYAATFNPKVIVDVGGFSRGTKNALGSAAASIFTNNDALWEQMKIAGIHSGDRVWRLPLWTHFTKTVRHCLPADVCETALNLGNSCRSAAFLQEFVCRGDWLHMDIYGITHQEEDLVKYLKPGMTGRPTRTLIEFLAQFAFKPEDDNNGRNQKKAIGFEEMTCRDDSSHPCK